MLILWNSFLFAFHDEITVSGSPFSMIVYTATTGSEPDAVLDTSTTYTEYHDSGTRKITGSVDTNSPSNTTLKITLAAPIGGSSAGAKILSTSATDLVTSIPAGGHSNMLITYNFSALVAAGVVFSVPRTVTLTLVVT